MPAALFIDGAFVHKVFRDRMDYFKFREMVEKDAGERLDEAYFFNADDDPPRAARLHDYLQVPPPNGPGFRVKLYWLGRKKLYWPQGLGGQAILHPTAKDDSGQPLQYEQTTQKGVDVGLVYHMTRSLTRRKWTKLYLAAGDGDFHEPIQHMVETDGIDVVLIGSARNTSSELSAYARKIIDITVDPVHSSLILPAR